MLTTSGKSKRVLSIFSLVMINVIAVDSLRTLSISAEYGFSIVFFYLLGAIIFFIPTALVAAELATGWPRLGGLYVWVREAFGERWGFFAIWLQWIYNVVWYPTILAFLAGTIAYIINPDLANDKTFLLITVISTFWIATILDCFGMEISGWISTLGAIVGTILPMLLIIGIGGVWLMNGKPSHVTFDLEHFFPSVRDVKNLAFFTGILFGLIGMEMSAVHAEEVKNPQRSYPIALLISSSIILSTLILSSLSIALIVPHDKLNLVSGLVEAFDMFFNMFGISWMTPVIAILIVLGGISSVSAWIIGPTKGLLAAARDVNAPRLLQKANKFGAPTPILILQGLIFTVLCSVFILMPTINSSYWVLSALTAQLAMVVYIFMFAAVIRLRYSQPEVVRAFKIPGQYLVWLVALLGILACTGAIILGFFPPEEMKITNIFTYETILIIGIIVLSLPPLFLVNSK